MVNLNKGIPVRFTVDDSYVFRIDATDYSIKKRRALRAVLEALDIDWYEGYYLGEKK